MPTTGGLLDQQASHVNKMDTVLRARSEIEANAMNKAKARQDLEDM